MTRAGDTTSAAYHEAAHAVVSYRTSGVADALSLVPNNETGTLGHAVDTTSDSFNKTHMEARVLSLYAGGHAQRRFDPTCGDDGCEDDEAEARAILDAHGWTDREAELRAESERLVAVHWHEIVSVVAHLLEMRTLDGTEIEIIADGAAGDPESGPEALARYRRLKSGPEREPRYECS